MEEDASSTLLCTLRSGLLQVAVAHLRAPPSSDRRVTLRCPACLRKGLSAVGGFAWPSIAWCSRNRAGRLHAPSAGGARGSRRLVSSSRAGHGSDDQYRPDGRRRRYLAQGAAADAETRRCARRRDTAFRVRRAAAAALARALCLPAAATPACPALLWHGCVTSLALVPSWRVQPSSRMPAASSDQETKRVPYSQQQRLPPWKMENVRWTMGGYITFVHVLALCALRYVPACQTATLWWAFVLWPISGFGITGGAHRLWSHRSYTASAPYRCVLMIFNSIANQGSIWHWSRDHRTHHFHSETVADPHDAIRGFFFAHIGWLYLKKDKRVAEAGSMVNMDDLRADGFVMVRAHGTRHAASARARVRAFRRFAPHCAPRPSLPSPPLPAAFASAASQTQKRYDPWWNIFWCFFFPALVATYGWGEQFSNGLMVCGALRYTWVLHCTWLVNSAAHLWGERPYDPNSNPAENPFVSIAAIGEGWHNWHHKYPFDYAASEYGVMRQFNPTKMVIDACASVGLVTERKRATGMWARERAKLAAEAKKAR